MLRPVTRIVVLTGGIGSGKSTVAGLLAERGATLIDADAIVHELQAPGQPLLREIAEAFGAELIDPSGALDREALGARVFRDPGQRARLNAIVHPAVGAEVARRLAAARERGDALVVVDIPLYFEGRARGAATASALPADQVLLVYVPEALQLERTVRRDGCSPDEARRRIASQLPIEEKRALADVVFDNSGSPDETRRQVEAWLQDLGLASP